MKYQDGDTLDPYTQSLIDSGKFKMGPDGALVPTTREEKLASFLFVENPDGTLRNATPEEYARNAQAASRAQAQEDITAERDSIAQARMRQNPMLTDADLEYYQSLPGPMTEYEARHFATRAFDPSQPPNMAFSMLAGSGGPGAVADLIGSAAAKGVQKVGTNMLRRGLMSGVDEAVEIGDDYVRASRPTAANQGEYVDFVEDVATARPAAGALPEGQAARGLPEASAPVTPKNRQLPAGQQSSGRTFYGNEPYQYRHTTGSVDAAGNPIGGRYGNNVPGGTSIGQQGIVRSGSGVPARPSNVPATRGNTSLGPASRVGRVTPEPTPRPGTRALPEAGPRTIEVTGSSRALPNMRMPRTPGTPIGAFLDLENGPYEGEGMASGSTENVGSLGTPVRGGQGGSGSTSGGGSNGSNSSSGGSGSGSGSSESKGSPEFNQAFREARHRGDMIFEWNGKSYGTRRKGETNDEHRMAMDQVRIKSRGAQMRNTPTEIGIQEPKEISFDRPTAQLQTPQRPAAQKASPKSEPTGRAKIKANRQENRSIRQGIRSERQANRKENRAGRLEDRAAKLRGNSKPTPKPAATSNKAKEDKAMQQINAAANRPMKTGGEMIKRADGSYSNRGLWDNIRANEGSGKKPTKEMLKQEKKIKAESKKDGGLKTPTNKGLKKLPKNVRNKMGFKKEGGLKDRRK